MQVIPEATINTDTSYEDSVFFEKASINNSRLIVNGNIHINQLVSSSGAYIESHMVTFRLPTTINGFIVADRFYAEDGVHINGQLRARLSFFWNSAEIDNLISDEIQGHGTLISNNIRARKIWVENDLLARTICANQVIVAYGSLLVPNLCVQEANADIIGNYGNERLPSNLHYKWPRPMGHHPPNLKFETLILNAKAAFLKHTLNFPELLEIIQKSEDEIKSWDDATLFLRKYLPTFKKYYNNLDGCMQQFIDSIAEHGFPTLFWKKYDRR